MATSNPIDLQLGGPKAPEETYAAFKVEQRGIELIPESEKKMTPWGLFWLWAGGIWNVEFLVYGALAISFGLSFGQAVLAILVGNVFYVFLGLASLPGPETGTTAFMVSRAPFGLNGNRLVSLFNWLTQVGFEIEGIVLIVLVALAMFARGGVGPGTPLKIGLIVAAVAIQFIVPFLGHAMITKTLRYLSFVFIVLFAVMAILVVPHVNLGHFHQQASWAVWTTAVVLLVAAGGLGWTENASDFSRYLPRKTARAKTFWAATLGGAIPSILLELLGAAAFVVSPKVTAVTGVPSSFASWFFWPFLILVLPQLFAINSLDLYSSGVTLQALGIPVKRWGAVLIDTIVAGAVTALVIFKGNFYTDLSGFLDYIVVWLGPWFGILMADYLLRRGRYDPDSLAAKRGGLYWRSGGFNWKAIIAQVVGMAAAMMWIDAQFYVPSYLGPISKATGGADFSWAVGIVVGGLVYLVLSIGSVGRERAGATGSVTQGSEVVG
ncbi:MAG: thiamine permease [Candidatus Dormibacteraeota bacterium]|nr:thiamine permease [Candidatus Dormibacteraeota bacterium]